jgi:hypothetical protein
LNNIKNIPNQIIRADLYRQWHKAVSIVLFGIPNDRVTCKKCRFFIKKFTGHMNKSCYIEDMINATDSLNLEMYLTDLVNFTPTGKHTVTNIPIPDMNIKANVEKMETLRNIVRNSYEIKIILSKQDEHELNKINKVMGEDGETIDKNQKYITMSQMFGHYMSHVITSTYLEVDYGYALTVHKSQGSTYDDVYIEYSNILENKKDTEKNKLLYTAITRSSNKLHVYN